MLAFLRVYEKSIKKTFVTIYLDLCDVKYLVSNGLNLISVVQTISYGKFLKGLMKHTFNISLN